MRSDEHPSLVVTGGSGGIGAALCLAAARDGWRVWIGYATRRDRATALAEEVRALGHSAAPVALPLDDPEELRRGIETIAAAAPLPSAAVLCGGPPPDVGSLLKLSPGQFRRQLDCAVVGHAVLMAELWRLCFRGRGGGHLVGVSSAAVGPPAAAHMASYVTAKSGFEALLRAAAAEFGRSGLRVSIVRPGYVETPMLDAFDQRLLDRERRLMSAGRFLQPVEVADALLAALGNPPERGTVAEIAVKAPEVALA